MYTTLLTHLRPHLDEIVAIMLLRRFGTKRFPGVENAKVMFTTTGKLPGGIKAKSIEKKGILPIGVGGGPFDEHPSMSSERKYGECAATLVANKFMLNVENLDPLLREVAHCDLTNRVSPSELATIIKVRHRHNPSNAIKVMEWAGLAVEALLRVGDVRRYTYPSNRIKETGIALIHSKEWKNERALEQFRSMLARADGAARTHLTELGHVVEVIRKYSGDQIAEMWLTEALVDLYKDNCLFFRAVDEIQKTDVTEIKIRTCRIPLLSIVSDNELIAAAARSKWGGYSALVIQKTTKGNMSVFLNVRHSGVKEERLNLDTMTSFIRFEDLTRHGRHYSGHFKDLAQDGVMPISPLWYYPRDNSILLNGSATTPDIQPTRVTLEKAVEISQHAFHPQLASEWWYRNACQQKRRETNSLPNIIVDESIMPPSEVVEMELERMMIESNG